MDPKISSPINFNKLPTPPSPGNISSLANPSTLSNLSKSNLPSTFGDQIKNTATQQIIKAATESTITKLYKEKADLIQEGIQLDINHQLTLQNLQYKHTPKKQVQNGQTVDILPELNDEEYQKAVNNENKNYQEAKNNLQERKTQNQKNIDDYLKDPFKKQKDEIQKRKIKRDKRKKRTKEEKKRARKARAKSVFQNAKKSLVPILTLTLTNQLANIIAQNDKIGKLVDSTNAIITDANESGDATKLQNAKVARDNAIKIINDNENKIRKVQQQIDRISRIISIFNIIVTIISAIPLPTAVPPGIGIPLNLIIKFVKILDKANRILLALSALLPILSSVLDKAIAILEDYKSQLLDINGALDKASTNNFELLSGPGGLNSNTDFGTTNETYKGFRFAIREDNSFGGVHVGKFKRHYAVAIDINDVDVLKSEYSFTLDPNDLIDQLKLVIDQQGLFTGDGNSSPNGNSNNPNTSNNSNTSIKPNKSNPNLTSTLIPSISSINTLSKTTKSPPQPKVIIGPSSGITAKIPLGVLDRAKLVAVAAASGPDPRPKIDVAFIFAADIKWHQEDKKYKDSIKANSNINY